MKRALVLAGGGARGSYQVGMLEELVGVQQLDFDILRGVSVGALNAAFLAQAGAGAAALAEKVVQLRAVWSGLRGNGDVYSGGFGGLARLLFGADSLYSLKPLRGLIDRKLDLAAMRASPRDFRVGTVSLVSGRYAEWSKDRADFVDRLVASSSIPVVFPFVEFPADQDVLVDGGVRDITPLGSAFEGGAEEIWVLLTSRAEREPDGRFPRAANMPDPPDRWRDNWLGTRVNGMDVLKRSVDLLTDEIYLSDLREALAWNEVAEGVQRAARAAAARGGAPMAEVEDLQRCLQQRVKRRHVPIHVLAPQEWFGDDNSATEFDPARIARAIEHGREIARDRSRWLWPPA